MASSLLASIGAFVGLPHLGRTPRRKSYSIKRIDD